MDDLDIRLLAVDLADDKYIGVIQEPMSHDDLRKLIKYTNELIALKQAYMNQNPELPAE